MNALPTDQHRSEGEEEVGGLELADASENYCALMLEVREAAAARGLTFREVMTAMGRMAIAAMSCREWADGDIFNTEDMTMAIAQKIGGAAGGAVPSLNGGMRTPEPVLRPLADPVKLPKGIEMGIGEPPPSIEKKNNGKVNPLVAFIATLSVGGWVKFDTAEHSKMSISWALRAVKKASPAWDFEKRLSIDGECVVIVRKK